MSEPKKLTTPEQDIANIDLQISALQHERERIEAYVELKARYSDERPKLEVRPRPKLRQPSSASEANGAEGGSKPRVKPDNIPTIPLMLFQALQEADRQGKRGLKPIEMTEYVQKHFWPEVDSMAISPIAWRMWKRGDLVKDGELYRLSKKKGGGSVVAN